jgi:hypothetical protein
VVNLELLVRIRQHLNLENQRVWKMKWEDVSVAANNVEIK